MASATSAGAGRTGRELPKRPPANGAFSRLRPLARQGGYEAVQMRDVAAAAEVALGTLYRHYTSKDQLLLAVQLDQTETLRRRLQLQPPRGATPAIRVADVLRRACKGLDRDPLVTGAMVRAMFAAEPDVVDMKRDVQAQLRGIIESAIGDGEPSLDGVVDVLGHVWFAAIAFWASGLTDGTAMADRLANAALLLLE